MGFLDLSREEKTRWALNNFRLQGELLFCEDIKLTSYQLNYLNKIGLDKVELTVCFNANIKNTPKNIKCTQIANSCFKGDDGIYEFTFCFTEYKNRLDSFTPNIVYLLSNVQLKKIALSFDSFLIGDVRSDVNDCITDHIV